MEEMALEDSLTMGAQVYTACRAELQRIGAQIYLKGKSGVKSGLDPKYIYLVDLGSGLMPPKHKHYSYPCVTTQDVTTLVPCLQNLHLIHPSNNLFGPF